MAYIATEFATELGSTWGDQSGPEVSDDLESSDNTGRYGTCGDLPRRPRANFECGAFDRSATSPRGRARGFAKNPAGRGGYVTKRPGRDKAGGRLPLPACGGRVGVRGGTDADQGICRSPSPDLASLGRPLPAGGER